jgi:sugar phosphate isomerase/epimerase
MYNIVNCISNIHDFNKPIYIQQGIGVEIQDFVKPDLLDKGWEERVEEYKSALDGFSNTLSLHGPFLDLKPVSPDKKIRQASYERYILTLNIGKKLDVDYIIFHSQISPWIKDPNIKELTNRLNKEFWHLILKEVVDYKGKILIENIFEDNPNFIKDLVDTINLPNVKVCLDIGHALLESKDDLENWIKVLKERIEYIHFHWNGGAYDEHHRPSNENIAFLKRLLDKYSINPIIALEYDIDNLNDEIKRIRNT